VGSIDGGPKGDLFSYRTFFDYEARLAASCGASQRLTRETYAARRCS